jgi:hypothetical protein
MNRTGSMKIFFILFTALTVSGFIVICTLGQVVRHERVEAKLSAVYSSEPEPPATIVREYDGRVCVFIGDSTAPYRTLDIDVSLLSDYDRQMLRRGVVMESDEELARFIEDFST